jgi:hypothetical protein
MNAEMDSASPFAGLLVGQPTLNRQLRMGTFAALDQRIATRFAIKPMDLAESAAYLRHHLKLAPLTELPAEGFLIGGHCPVRLVRFPVHDRKGRLTPGSGRTGRCRDWRALGDRRPLGALSAG